MSEPKLLVGSEMTYLSVVSYSDVYVTMLALMASLLTMGPHYSVGPTCNPRARSKPTKQCPTYCIHPGTNLYTLIAMLYINSTIANDL